MCGRMTEPSRLISSPAVFGSGELKVKTLLSKYEYIFSSSNEIYSANKSKEVILYKSSTKIRSVCFCDSNVHLLFGLDIGMLVAF